MVRGEGEGEDAEDRAESRVSSRGDEDAEDADGETVEETALLLEARMVRHRRRRVPLRHPSRRRLARTEAAGERELTKSWARGSRGFSPSVINAFSFS